MKHLDISSINLHIDNVKWKSNDFGNKIVSFKKSALRHA